MNGSIDGRIPHALVCESPEHCQSVSSGSIKNNKAFSFGGMSLGTQKKKDKQYPTKLAAAKQMAMSKTTTISSQRNVQAAAATQYSINAQNDRANSFQSS